MTIQEKILLLEQLQVPLGAPLGGEALLFDGGTLQQFDNGAIYLRPGGEPFEVHGAIYIRYVDMGEVLSQLGYPISDEADDPNKPQGRLNLFQNGSLSWSPTNGVSQTFNDVNPIAQVMVKLQDSIPVNLSQGETISLAELGQRVTNAGFPSGDSAIATLEDILPGLVLKRVFDSLSPQEIRDLVVDAQARNSQYQPPNFENCLEIDCPNGVDLNPVVAAFKGWGVIQYAYIAPLPSEPSVTGFFNPLFPDQGYLRGGDEGIGVETAWAKGADGAGTSFIDIERGWLFTHHDLPQTIQLLDGSIRFDSMGHGAASLGEIVAIDNSKGVVGIAPSANASALSYYIPEQGSNEWRSRNRVASMVLKAGKLLSFGDVILLEVQFLDFLNGPDTLVPAETDPFVFEAIRLATEKGVIVVEPAGNGSSNLDNFRDVNGEEMLHVGMPTFKESGAIMVGAGVAESPHPLDVHSSSFSNFGTRVDCYAWDTHVVTTGSTTDPGDRDGYTTGPFATGTSAASAIIAGVCLLVQNLQHLMTPISGPTGKLGPFDMRRLLRDSRNGTRSPDPIGSMPNFEKIIPNEYS